MAATAQDPSAPLKASEKKDEDYDEDLEFSPFYGIEKGAILQDARCFHTPQVDAKKARQIITKLLYLLNQGQSFTKKESSEVFFAATKLFQHKDTELRRMVYLCIKDISPSADEVIIITSSLIKDMNSKNDLYRANAIRVLCKIIDSQLLSQIERYLKQAVVDKSPLVSSAALVSGMHLLYNNAELVKRWYNEIQEAMQSKNPMVQFHAVMLQHAFRSSDRLAVNKLVSGLTRNNLRSPIQPMAQCLLIRYISQVISDSQPDPKGEVRPFYEYLEKCLRHKSEMVIFEAAQAITNLKDFTSREISPAISVLQLFLSSSKPVLKFASVRILNKVAMTHPLAVANCNIDMESLISDPNRSIATLAITTLLKTGNEGSVDRLLKQIGTFMSDISDDFKIVVVEAIRSLCLKFPKKHRSLMNFLSGVLREEGGFEYKRAIVDSILVLIREIPEAKETGLGHLCEFIEDCEFTYLSTQILHLLGTEGPKTSEPSKYIRFINNRVVLENATVRAAAVSSLARFGAEIESLRSRILILLKRALYDNDDEVRDRATLYIEQLSGKAGGMEAISAKPTKFPLKNLEKALLLYLDTSTESPFDLISVPADVEEVDQNGNQKMLMATNVNVVPAEEAISNVEIEEFIEKLNSIEEFQNLGPIFKTCDPIKLTEEDTEYSISLVKHIYKSHVIFQFNCINTIAEQVLENVRVVMDLVDYDGDYYEELFIPIEKLEYNKYGHTYTLVSHESENYIPAKIPSTLKFTVKEIDPSTGEIEVSGFEDEYELEDIEVYSSDFIKKLPVTNFKALWEELGEKNDVTDDYGLGTRNNLEEAIDAVIRQLGMHVCDGTDVVPPHARSHTVLLAGTYITGENCLAKIDFGIDSHKDVAMRMSSRSTIYEISQKLHLIIEEA